MYRCRLKKKRDCVSGGCCRPVWTAGGSWETLSSPTGTQSSCDPKPNTTPSAPSCAACRASGGGEAPQADNRRRPMASVEDSVVPMTLMHWKCSAHSQDYSRVFEDWHFKKDPSVFTKLKKKPISKWNFHFLSTNQLINKKVFPLRLKTCWKYSENIFPPQHCLKPAWVVSMSAPDFERIIPPKLVFSIS